jgi:NDP-sugar pyrophosphorylase family protein
MTKAVILCGGEGTRLRPITYKIPKPLVPLQGKTLLEHIIDLFKKYDIQEIVLSVGYLKNTIKEYFGDGKKFGVSIKYLEEDEPLGTGGPLLLGKNMLNDTFIVSNGDELKNIDLLEMMNKHRKNNAMITIALTRVDDPSHYGVAKMRGEQIEEFIEKPKKEEAPSNLINAGLYIMEPEVIDMIKGRCSLERDIFPKIAGMGKLFGFHFSGQWFDTGNMERYENAIKNWRGI